MATFKTREPEPGSFHLPSPEEILERCGTIVGVKAQALESGTPAFESHLLVT